MTKRLLPFLFFSLFIIPAYSQEKDFGIWYEVALRKSITDKLDFEGGVSIRTYQFGSKIEQSFIEAGVDYGITDFLSAAASYRLANFAEEDYDEHYLQHKFFLDLKGKFDVSAIDFNARLRLQTRIKTSEYDRDYNSAGRMRLKATYKTPSFPVNPFFYVETFSPLFRDVDKFIGKYRLCGGIEINVNKKLSFEIGYLFERDYIPDLVDFHILALDYDIKFAKKGAAKPENSLNTDPK